MCATIDSINKYRPTPIIGKIRIKMTQGIFIEDVLFDAYNPKTKIPLKILVNKFMISAYSFKRVTIVIIKITSRRMQIMEKHSRFTPFFVFALPSKVSCFIYISPSYLFNFLPKFRGTYGIFSFLCISLSASMMALAE